VISPADLHEATPSAPNGTAVLLLAGSSGRVERERADVLSGTGARVRAIRWFGGARQRPTPREVPLELFAEQISSLRQEADRVVLFGTSFGAEAALVTASRFAVDGVIAAAPSSVVWAGTDGTSSSSHWTHDGVPLPAVSFDPTWIPDAEPPAFLPLYESSLRVDENATAAARIRVEDITGDVLLIAAGDDQVWPSIHFAGVIEHVRRDAGLKTTIISHPQAGHRMILPGEKAVNGGVTMRRGGTPEADAELGARAWPEIARMLQPMS
jgi:pimeloyl-ACP methyl ester carboxylesterase